MTPTPPTPCPLSWSSLLRFVDSQHRRRCRRCVALHGDELAAWLNACGWTADGRVPGVWRHSGHGVERNLIGALAVQAAVLAQAVLVPRGWVLASGLVSKRSGAWLAVFELLAPGERVHTELFMRRALLEAAC